MANTVIFALFLTCAVAFQASPEPEMDPMGAQLLLVPAGRAKYRSKFSPRVIEDGMRICPTEFKRGFSILCDIPGKRAVFFVNGEKVKVERHAPFYINGNFKKVVVPWESYPSWGTITCKVGRESVSRSVKFMC